MPRWGMCLLLLTLPNAAFAQVPNLRVEYEAYAAGLPIAHVETGLNFGPKAYEMSLAYHTTGVVGFLFRGHQTDAVSGVWSGNRAAPTRFLGQGVWRGEDRIADIGYDQGKPVVHQLIPPNAHEREEVPEALRAGAIDPLSALAILIRTVETTGRCEAAARTYDGRRTTEIEAHTAGEEQLAPSLRSSFQGKALRCDFVGRMLAGFRLDGSKEQESKPIHGSAWMASVAAGAPPLPVRMAFETRWFGDALMYLTSVGEGSERRIARGD
jgi:hypothetical protein